jgi:hypothetical protein
VHGLVTQLLGLSALSPGLELTKDQIEALVFPADPIVAQARGSYDWGTVVGSIPQVDAVTRPRETAFLEDVFSGAPDRQPRRAVLTGFSGAGKSTSASEFARRRVAAYDHIVWIDAVDETTIRRTAIPLLPERADEGDADGSDSRAEFRRLFANSSDTWLLVFDNASSERAIRDWCPVQGTWM